MSIKSAARSKAKFLILNLHGPLLHEVMYLYRRATDPQEVDRSIEKFVQSDLLSKNDLAKLRRSIRRDMKVHLIAPDEYFLYDFASKSDSEKNEFVGDLERIILCARLYNAVPEGQIFMDKMLTYQYFSPFFKREVIEITNSDDYEEYASFIKRHDSYMVKPPASSRGAGIRLECAPNGSAELRESFENLLNNAPVVLEELITQGDDMAKLHPQSVNTIRYATYFNGHQISILCCFVKIGRGSSVVDNGGAGGFLAAVDPDTGIITTPGRTELGEVVEVHPDTGIRIVGYQIPCWSELKRTVSELVKVLPQQKYVGWDLAFSASNGWVLVEGNSGGQFVGPQISMCKGIRPLVQNTFGSL